MEKKLLVAVLFIILSTQEIAALTRKCSSRSREFGGKCFRLTQRNCKIVCMHEEFEYGVCRQGRCYCMKSCGPNGKSPPLKPPSNGGTPPDQNGETPPDNDGPPEEFAQFLLEEPQASKV